MLRMSKQKELIFGGGFLTGDTAAEDIITPEDFTDEHKMIAKTTEDLVLGEVVPKIDNLENHEFEQSGALLKIAGDLVLLEADVPEEYAVMDLESMRASIIKDKFSRAGVVTVIHGTHVR